MGGGAFWDSTILWLTVVPLLVFGALVALTRGAFHMAGKRVGWGRCAIYVVGAFIGLQVIALVADAILP
ncbi:MAG: hypothetical protein HQL41_00450 [Alphaproteobacteria bacterium]|nr:hypothetical protein [Alphaproteobacteria bacterium]